LPILLTRYAISTKAVNKNDQPDGLLESFAPALSGDFSVDIEPPLGATAQYTLRRLRNGYIYLYDERRNKWQAYYINTAGFLSEFQFPKADWSKPAASSEDDKTPCDPANLAKGLCVTIMSPATEASIVWLTYSDVEWTEDVYLAHKKKSVRELHMRKFDVAAWLASGEHKHAAPIAELGERVAEFKSGVDAESFKPFSAALFNKVMAPEIVRSFDAIVKGKGVIVALDDPVAMAGELALLMSVRHEGIRQEDRFAKGLHASGTIKAFYNGLIDSVDAEVFNEANKSAEIYAMSKLGYSKMKELERENKSPYDALKAYPTNWAEEYRKLLNVTPEKLEKARNKAWAKYDNNSYFSMERMRTFDMQFKTASEMHYTETIEPLAKVHVAWMQSPCMIEYFKNNFSLLDKRAKLTYRECFFLAMGTTQMWQPCRKLYEKWLAEADWRDRNNLLVRAIIFNSDVLAPMLDRLAAEYQEMLDALKASPELEENSTENFVVRLPPMTEGLLSTVEALFSQTGKIFPISYTMLGLGSRYSAIASEVLIRPPDSINRVMALMSLEAGKGVIVPTEIYGTKMATAWYGMEKALGIAGETGVTMGRPNEVRRLFMQRAEVALGNIEGKPAWGLRAYHLLSPEQVRGLIDWKLGMIEKRQSALVQSLSKTLYVSSMSDYMRLLHTDSGYTLRATLPADIKRAVSAMYDQASAESKLFYTKSGEWALRGASWSFVVLILSTVGLRQTWKALVQPDQDGVQLYESIGRFGIMVACTVSSAAGIVEGLEMAMRARPELAEYLPQYRWMSNPLVAKLARFPAAYAAAVMCAFDNADGFQALETGRNQLAAAYFLSAIVDFTSAAVMLAAFSGIGILVGVLAVATSFLINELEVDVYQDWLERCEFGRGVEGSGKHKYPSVLVAETAWQNALESAGVYNRTVRRNKEVIMWRQAMDNLSSGVR
jgi:hypothetical protein